MSGLPYHAKAMLGRGGVVATMELAGCTLPVHNDLITIISSDGNKHLDQASLLARSCYVDSLPAIKAMGIVGSVKLCRCHDFAWEAALLLWQKSCYMYPECLMLVGTGI